MEDGCYCILLRKASRKVSSLYDEALSPLGINVAQFSLMRHIAAGAPVSLTDVAQRLELDRSTVGRNVKVLQRHGWVASARGRDQREAVLSLTEAGEGILDAGAPLWREAQTRIGRQFAAAAGPLRALIEGL